MTYQKDEVGIRQTSANAASAIVVAEVNAGIVKSHDTIVKRFEELRNDIFADLDEARGRDNEMFKAEEAASPKRTPARDSGKQGGSEPSGGSSKWLDEALADPGAVVVKGGKFDGKTISFIYDLPASAAEEYGYVDGNSRGKAGSKYIQWMTGNEKNPKMAQVAKAFLDAKRAADAA